MMALCGVALSATQAQPGWAAPSMHTALAAAGATPGAVDVRSYGAVGDGTADDTAAFLRAEDAAVASALRYPSGPSGAPQAVVYVPPGTYRLIRLTFRSNLRMEVDAGAVLEQAGGRFVDTTSMVATLILWDGPGGSPLSNVTLTGVGSSTDGIKALAGPVFPGWSLSSDFTFNLDPATTSGSVLEAGVQALNVTDFLIQNVFSIQNATQPASLPTTQDGWWPETQKAALGLRERFDTPSNGSVFYDPHNGTVSNWYNIGAPKGYGPNQVNAAHNVRFQHIFSQGGTAMRFETDASQGKSFASEIRGVSADDIAGLNCNRAVSFSPHAQMNYDVAVTHVQAVSCAAGVVESIDGTNKLPPGAFINSSIANVSVRSGNAAQNASPSGPGLWTVGVSQTAFAKDKSRQASWSVLYAAGTFSCQGAFLSAPNLVLTVNGFVRPICLP